MGEHRTVSLDTWDMFIATAIAVALMMLSVDAGRIATALEDIRDSQQEQDR